MKLKQNLFLKQVLQSNLVKLISINDKKISVFNQKIEKASQCLLI